MTYIILFLFFAASFLTDIIIDMRDRIPLSHIWHEGLLFCLSLLALGWHIKLLIAKDKKILLIQKDLLESNETYKEWRESSRRSANEIREMIDIQFNRWNLSESEKDVALLLIKGLSMKEIAELRKTHEKTVRQQATMIYKKAEISGRQELSAFFLEDILSTT